MPALQNIGYFSVDEKFPSGLASTWAGNVRLAALFEGDGKANIWLRLFDRSLQTVSVYTFDATFSGDDPVVTPDWTRRFPGSRYTIDYPGLPSSIPAEVFFATLPDNQFGLYLIAFRTRDRGWQHAAPSLRGPRVLLAGGNAYGAEAANPETAKYSLGD